MTEPQSLEEYTARYHENTEITGGGLAVVNHFACPFCAAPHFACVRIMDFPPRNERDFACKECGRSGRFITTRAPGSQDVSMSTQFVQSGGDDPPAWLVPPPPRIDRTE